MKEKLAKIYNNKILKTIFKTIKVIATVFIVALAAVILVQRVSNNKLSIGGIQIFTVVSESMVPKYNVFDMLIAKKVEAKDLKVGDDLVYIGKVGSFKDKIVTHEIINIGSKNGKYEFVTKGIANDIEDPLVSEDQIYGKVIYKTKFLSWCSKLINSLYGFYFIIFVPMVILIFVEVLEELNIRAKRRELNMNK